MSQQPGTATPKLVFSSKGNSHPFQERIVHLTEPQKVGRSVGRVKPASNNLIFDCKVLSRNHGIVWYEHGQFWVQDTKSANGTFVANQRLNKGSEESPPKEIYHEDLIQFGVDVVENQRNGVSVTHGCIIGVVYLYHPDGSEAKPVCSPGSNNQILFSSGLPIPTQDLYQLQKYLEEASHREQVLESKLAALQRIVADTRTCSAQSWKALVEEDSLLTRMELLESQLFILGKNMGDEGLQKEIKLLNEDKLKYAEDAKSSVEKIVKEKQQIECKLSEVERCCSEAEDDCEHLRTTNVETNNRLQELATKHSELLDQVSQLKTKLTEAETARTEISDAYKTEKESLEKEVDALNQTSLELNNKITELEQKLASATAGTPLDEFPNEGENDNDSSRILNDSINAEEPISSEDRVSHIDDINNQATNDSVVTAEVETDRASVAYNERSVDQAIDKQREAEALSFSESDDLSSTQIESSPDSQTTVAEDVDDIVNDEILDDDFQIGDSGFNESEIYLSALESDIRMHSQQLDQFCSGLTDERKAEFDSLKQNNERLLTNVEMLKSSVEQKLKSLETLESQLSDARTSMHNEKVEQSKKLAFKDSEITRLMRQLSSAKEAESQARAEVDGVIEKQLEQERRENRAECNRLKEKLRETEEALKRATERSQMLDRSVGSLTSGLAMESISESTAAAPPSDNQDENSDADGLSVEELPVGAFHRTPVKFIDKLRRSEAERERLESELRFVQLRLKDNQSEIVVALANLKSSLGHLRERYLVAKGGQMPESGRGGDGKEQEQMDGAITALQLVSEELCNLQKNRQSLRASSNSIVDRVSKLPQSDASEQESILLLSKVPMFIIILAVLCAMFKFIFPDSA
ncbi:uncharacterized protein LOC142339425 isoform X2 [Convolutriloba macropyga]|uniref:uncharacterized protein LOC142339425 isoform X2 n=1 Tax=Convolutriloba macropyga TaxID=536237 RepID=UPI003F52752D